MSLPPIRGSVTVITGASSGIGRAAAQEFARAGARVVLSSRNEDRLREMESEIAAYPAEVLVIPADVTREDQVRSLMTATLARFGRIDILICNAGVGLYSPVKDLPEHALRQVFEVNFHGVVRCIQAALPSMLERGTGLIQIISSVLGRRSVPGYAGYCATKFALYAVAESLHVELAGTGVSVQTVYPALTATEFSGNSILRAPSGARSHMKAMPAEQVARHMLRAARRGSRDHMVTTSGRLLALLNGLAPGLVDRVIARLMRPAMAGDARALPDRRQ